MLKGEDYLKNIIFGDLRKGDPNWDLPHTEAVVHHIKQIVKNSPQLNLDLVVLVFAAYGHDWGYAKFYKKGESLSREDYMKAKKLHMGLGADKMKKVLSNGVFDHLTKNQKKRILHLISVHDNLDILKENDELALMEADTLGGLDINFVKPSFTKEENEKHMQGVLKKRRPKFITNYGKKKFDELFKLRKKYYER